jgi:ubiquinone/menaquinone biosynthesis C-methylase UbiE
MLSKDHGVSRVKEYDSWHNSLAATEVSSTGLHHPWHLTVERLLPSLQGKKVLEIGCGRGDFAIHLAGKYPGAQIHAVDFSQAAIDIAKSKAARSGAVVNFRTDDAESLSFEDRSFDFAISCECMEHVGDPTRMAKEIYRVLRPAGRFVLTTENYFNARVLAWLQAWILGKPFNSGSGVQPRENFFVFWRVKNILSMSGLQVEHMESNHVQWLLLPRTDPGKLCTRNFESPFLKRVFRPFGRHFTFCGKRPPVGTGASDF